VEIDGRSVVDGRLGSLEEQTLQAELVPTAPSGLGRFRVALPFSAARNFGSTFTTDLARPRSL